MSDSVVYVYIKRHGRSIGYFRIFPEHNFGLFQCYRILFSSHEQWALPILLCPSSSVVIVCRSLSAAAYVNISLKRLPLLQFSSDFDKTWYIWSLYILINIITWEGEVTVKVLGPIVSFPAYRHSYRNSPKHNLLSKLAEVIMTWETTSFLLTFFMSYKVL